jgi:glycosyltransferase involved in cell wall biosynthesis
MWIAIISPHSLSLTDGSSVLSYNIAQALSNKNLNVKLITIDTPSIISETKLNFPLYLYVERNRNTLLDPTKLYMLTLRDLKKVCNNADLIHIVGNYNPFIVSLISRRFKKPTLIHVHIRVNKNVAKLFNSLSLYNLLGIKRVIATSIDIARQIRATDVVLPPIDCNLFKPSKPANITEDVNMLYLGSIQRFDVLTALKIMHILRLNYGIRSSLTIVSRFSEEKMLVPIVLKLATKYGLEKHVKVFVKTLSLREKLELLDKSTFYVGLLLHNRKYPFVEPPISILEALSMGKPVIGYEDIGLNSLPKNSSIIVLNPRKVNVEQVAGIIAEKISSLNEISHSARSLALKTFSYEAISSKLASIYNELLTSLG